MTDADTVTGRRPRSRWLTVSLYLLAVMVIAADLWGVVFWARVGGRVGVPAATVGIAVAVALTAVLVVDVRRQRSEEPPGGGR